MLPRLFFPGPTRHPVVRNAGFESSGRHPWREAAATIRCLLRRVLTLVLALTGLQMTAAAAEPPWQLSGRCPPGFELLAVGSCRLVTLYDRYGSLRDAGLGGTRTSLPPRRDGFTPQQIDLGRYLFFDPLLSADGSVACASCHRPDRGFSDGQPRSVGWRGERTRRGAPTLWNVGFLRHLFWDGRAASLEEQAQGPLFARSEMGSTPERLRRVLNDSEVYRALFRQAFGDAEVITLDQVYTALAAFQSSLISFNSRYDRYAHGYAQALSQEEIDGLNVFRSFVARCSECHTPPLFTNQQIAVIGAPEPEGLPFDPGAGPVMDAPPLRGGFRVPTLRNIALTAPYMHSGTFASLRDAVTFYNGGRGHALPEPGLQLHWHITSPELTEREISLLVAFLGTLTDETFVPRVPAELPSGLPLPYVPDAASSAIAARANPTRETDP